MFSTAPNTPHSTTLADAQAKLLAACQEYLRSHASSLVAVAHFTAGEAGANLARHVCADILAARRWHPAFAHRLRKLTGLLQLEHLEALESPYPVPVAVLDPEHTQVAACCRHTDQLDTFIARSDVISAHVARLPRVPVQRPLRSA